MSAPKFDDYPFEIRRLAAEDGGGFLITFPDLPGCMSDGETPDEALANGRGAFEAWMDTCRSENRAIPTPGARGMEAARFVQRLPRYMHESLTAAAAAEGVSLNTLVTSFVAEGLSRLDARPTHKQTVQHIANVARVDAVSRTVAFSIVPKHSLGQPENVTSAGADSKTNVFHALGSRSLQ